MTTHTLEKPILVCIHDATPARAREIHSMIRDLTPLVGRRLSFGVVPDWHGEWPLTAHRDFCELLQRTSEELLLHGYYHRRHGGRGITTWLTDGCDEMNGLDPEATRRTIERGQQVFIDVFGEPARGFIAPGWQPGVVRPEDARPEDARPELARPRNSPPMDHGLEHVLGFFSLQSGDGGSIPLATWTWDCGRWGWLGHIGHGIGHLRHHSIERRVPVLAIHPSDLGRGFWPGILRLTCDLLARGYEPTTPADLVRAAWAIDVEVGL